MRSATFITVRLPTTAAQFLRCPSLDRMQLRARETSAKLLSKLVANSNLGGGLGPEPLCPRHLHSRSEWQIRLGAALSRRRARGRAHPERGAVYRAYHALLMYKRMRSQDLRAFGDGARHAGNSHGRPVLVQAAWSYRHRPQTSVDSQRRQQGQPPAVITHAWKAQQRLHPNPSARSHDANG